MISYVYFLSNDLLQIMNEYSKFTIMLLSLIFVNAPGSSIQVCYFLFSKHVFASIVFRHFSPHNLIHEIYSYSRTPIHEAQ